MAIPPPPPGSPPLSLSSSFASLALSSTASGIGFPSPPPSDVASYDLGSDNSDDEFIVLQRSQSGTGYHGALAAGLAAGLAAAPDAGQGGTGLVSDEAGAAASETAALTDDNGLVLASWASVANSGDGDRHDSDDDDGGSRPLRWADEGEDELGLPPALVAALSTTGERTPVSGLRPVSSLEETPAPLAAPRRKWRRRGGKVKKTGSPPPALSLAPSAGVPVSSSSAASASAPSSIASSSSPSSRSSLAPSHAHLSIPLLRNRSSFGSDTPSTFSVSAGSDRSHVSRATPSEGASEDIVFEALTGSEEDGLSDICTDDSASAILSLFFDESNPFGGAGPGGGGALGKLRFWQALIVELGILPAPDAPWSELSSAGDDSDDDGTSLSGASDRTATEAEPFPTSLGAAKRLLKAEAHVNLVDYLRLRTRLESAQNDDERSKIRSQMKGLRKSSRTALRWYTIRNHKYAAKKLVKNAWLTPLMVDLV